MQEFFYFERLRCRDRFGSLEIIYVFCSSERSGWRDNGYPTFYLNKMEGVRHNACPCWIVEDTEDDEERRRWYAAEIEQ
jgi:hypothetical protein